jgi:HrpA-like RNA helicase
MSFFASLPPSISPSQRRNELARHDEHKKKRVTIQLDEDELLEEEAAAAEVVEIERHELEPMEEDNDDVQSMTTDRNTRNDVGTVGVLEHDNPLDESQFVAMRNKYFKSDRKPPCLLPIEAWKVRILECIETNQVTIIQGPTGCGKTTQVPQMIMDYCAERGESFNIICTQPRRIAAKSIAQRVCNENNWLLGEICDYQIGLDREYVASNTRLLFCTVGVLVQKLISQQSITHYTHILLDEVHERGEDTDLLMMIIKKFIMSFSFKAKIILMSATFDIDKLMKYFTLPIFDHQGQVKNNMIPSKIEIHEKPVELEKFYLDTLNVLLRENEQKGYKELKPIECLRDEPAISCDLYELVARLVNQLDNLDSKE